MLYLHGYAHKVVFIFDISCTNCISYFIIFFIHV